MLISGAGQARSASLQFSAASRLAKSLRRASQRTEGNLLKDEG
jgi:hypothetical protein